MGGINIINVFLDARRRQTLNRRLASRLSRRN
uniref:Uncharacterized protein n=1 Tax=Arundo donax TaxID=35708 RepID=A0A0A9CGV8_ARUDO